MFIYIITLVIHGRLLTINSVCMLVITLVIRLVIMNEPLYSLYMSSCIQ